MYDSGRIGGNAREEMREVAKAVCRKVEWLEARGGSSKTLVAVPAHCQVQYDRPHLSTEIGIVCIALGTYPYRYIPTGT